MSFAEKVQPHVSLDTRINGLIEQITQQPELRALISEYDGVTRGGRANATFSVVGLLRSDAVKASIKWMMLKHDISAIYPETNLEPFISHLIIGEKKTPELYLRSMLGANVTGETVIGDDKVDHQFTESQYDSRYVEGVGRFCTLIPQLTERLLAGKELQK